MLFRSEPDVVEKIRKSYKFVDVIFGTFNIFKIAELLYTHWQQAVHDLPFAYKLPNVKITKFFSKIPKKLKENA